MSKRDIIIPKFDSTILRKARLPMLTVYNRPSDYPDKFIVRMWDASESTRYITISASLEEARKSIPPSMVCLNRMEKDDPCIEEVWI